MGSSENFCLRWNDFESNVSSSFRDLRNESDFFDVTLACDDTSGRTLQAHKVILSACSSFFKRMLRSMATSAPGHPNPLIYLRGVRLVDLESVLDFMYHGEVNVAQDDLNTFLAVAEDLQIKGLTQQSKDQQQSSRKSRKIQNNQNNAAAAASGNAGPSAAKKARKEFVTIDDDDDDKEAVMNVKSEPAIVGFGEGPSTSRSASNVATPAQSFDDGSGQGGGRGDDDTYDDGFGGYDDGDTGDGMEGGMDGEDGTKGVVAVASDLSSASSNDPFRNVVRMSDGIRYQCLVCSKIFNQGGTGYRHFRLCHAGEKSYQRNMIPQKCPICNKSFKNEMSMKNHLRNYHNYKDYNSSFLPFTI